MLGAVEDSPRTELFLANIEGLFEIIHLVLSDARGPEEEEFLQRLHH